MRRHEPPSGFKGERRAIVVGAGLAGATAAWSLAQRGWRVQVLERGAQVATGASRLPWGVLHPHISTDDNDATRLTRAGFFAAQAMLDRAVGSGAALWRASGAFVQANDADEAVRWRQFADATSLPAEFARYLAPHEAASHIGVVPRASGWWFARAASVAAGQLCGALLEHAGVEVRLNTRVHSVRLEGGVCSVMSSDGATIANAPVCIVASALDAPRLLRLDHAPVRAVRGRMSWVNAPAFSALRAPVSGGGTLMPIDEKTALVGATYEFETADEVADDTAAMHAGNLQRLARLLADPIEARPSGVFDATRCVARDRLPLVGAVADEAAVAQAPALYAGAHLADLPRREGLFASFAFGSRGLALTPLAAQWLAAQLQGEPWPVERDLAARIDAARFLLEAVRHGRVEAKGKT